MIDYRNYTTVSAWRTACEEAGQEVSSVMCWEIERLAGIYKLSFPEALETCVMWGIIAIIDEGTVKLLRERNIKFLGDE